MKLLLALVGMWGCLATANAMDDAQTTAFDAQFDVASIASPDGGQLQFKIFYSPSLSFTIDVRGRFFTAFSEMGLNIKGEPPLGDKAKFLSVEKTLIDDKWQPVTGKTREARNRCKEMTVHLQSEAGGMVRPFDVVVRAYDDGFAFRYVLLPRPDKKEVVVTGERTHFKLEEDWECWYADHGSGNSSQESQYVPGKLSTIPPKASVGMPLLIKMDPTRYVALTEADLEDWAGMRFVPGKPSPVRVGLAAGSLDEHGNPRPKDVYVEAEEPVMQIALTTVTAKLPARTPWRVVMFGRSLGDLIKSDLIENLNPPSAIKDTSWIKPGIASWDWWSGRSRMETADIKKFIQLSADMGWPYMLIDAGWSYHNDQPDGDLLRVVDSVDMPELLRFAKDRNVRLWLWMSWRDVLRNDAYKKAFPMFRDWGIAGVKIDYMDREDQEMVDFYHTMFQATAENHLMLDLHGAYKPTGARRTWPNFITQEGVLGNEQNRGSRNDTARHNVTIPYTRGLLGPMDYTPGGFVNQTPEQFKPTDHGTTVPNTRCQELAKFVVFESPLQMACDYPDNYRDQPGVDFLKIVKTTWDEVKFLGGEVGESIVLARRSGDDWFIGGMTNEDARKRDVKLDFLPADKHYKATLWRDAPDADRDATKLVREEKEVSADDTLPFSMAPAGGFVVHLAPIE